MTSILTASAAELNLAKAIYLPPVSKNFIATG
jgi:hypothetical protein